ncbi:MAG: hypothetical protein ACXWHG_15230 [Thermoanaerobaculia bacterium]
MRTAAMVMIVMLVVLSGCATVAPAPRVSANVIFDNAAVIDGIHNGQSQDEVRGIMRHSAERREVGSVTESWGYMTSDKNNMMTWITFTDHRVTSLSHEVIAPD